MFDLNKILSCPKCGMEPKTRKNPSSIEKRYCFWCPTEGCACNKKIYGDTKSIAIANWNEYVGRSIKAGIYVNADNSDKSSNKKYMLVTKVPKTNHAFGQI